MHLPSDSDRFSKLASGFQSIVVAFAVVVGGIWTAYSFVSLKTVEKAELEATALKTKLPVLNISIGIGNERPRFEVIGPKPFPTPMPAVPITVTIKNIGSERFVVPMERSTMAVRRVQKLALNGPSLFGEDLLFRLEPVGAAESPSSGSVMPGGELIIHYLFPVTAPGFFVASFTTPASAESAGLTQNLHVDATPGSALPALPSWSASVFFASPP